jgi:hypothetical protein
MPQPMLAPVPATAAACLHLLCYGTAGRVDRVVIISAGSLIAARMYAAIDGLDAGVEFVEGYSLDTEMGARVPLEMIGRRLTSVQARTVLDAMRGAETARARIPSEPAETLKASAEPDPMVAPEPQPIEADSASITPEPVEAIQGPHPTQTDSAYPAKENDKSLKTQIASVQSLIASLLKRS